jgi:3-phenylpropionate/trans-cinnamate dioxygenase ferredoxin reductase subunit
MAQTLIIIGAGQAAAQAISSLRAAGFAGRIVLVGEEPHPPYQRPPLSKKYLAGEWGLDRVLLKADAFYTEMKVEVRLGQRAEAIDRKAGRVRLDGGESLAYDKLLIATGARPRTLDCPGAGLEGVHLFRSLADVDAVRPALKAGGRAAVIGGGYIGLEVAAVARGLGLSVTIIEMAERCLNRVVAPEVSAFFEGVHRAAGVEILTGERVASCEGANGKLARVTCASGREIAADIAIVGIGILPNQELAQQAGLPCDNGIVVDEFTLTADPAIAAAGDCANFPSALYGRRVRLESVQNAIEQAKAAAGALAGKPAVYDQVPWFWSDQYDLKLQIAGLNRGYDQMVLRGAPHERRFAAFYLKAGRLIAVDAVNAPAEYMVCLKQLIPARAVIAPERLADPKVSMKEMAAR